MQINSRIHFAQRGLLLRRLLIFNFMPRRGAKFTFDCRRIRQATLSEGSRASDESFHSFNVIQYRKSQDYVALGCFSRHGRGGFSNQLAVLIFSNTKRLLIFCNTRNCGGEK
jgi:hypothetical protein